jgi:hypothetical protein
MNPALRFGLAVLATWRVTHLLTAEDGPADIVVRLRAHVGAGRLGGVMDCFQGLSVWVAAPASLTVTGWRRPDPVSWLAISAAACLLELATDNERADNEEGNKP